MGCGMITKDQADKLLELVATLRDADSLLAWAVEFGKDYEEQDADMLQVLAHDAWVKYVEELQG